MRLVSLHEALDPSLGFLVNDVLKLKVKIEVDSLLAHKGHQTDAKDGCRGGEETPTDPRCTQVTSVTEVPAEPEPSTGDNDPLCGEYLVRAFCLKLHAPNPTLRQSAHLVMLHWTLENVSKLGTQKPFSDTFGAGGYHWWGPSATAPPMMNIKRSTALPH